MNCAAILRENAPLWGEWEPGEIIGTGAQSQVFLVTNRQGERRALKVTPLEDDPEQLAAAREQQALTVRMGRTRGFMPCLRDGELSGKDGFAAVILMPLLTPLSEIIMEREEKLSVGEIIAIGRDLSCALEQCRLHGIIHRDIKPANVFADGEGHYYLGDLGVARNLEHTMLATRKGTPAYMSPEIASGKPCSHLSDVYSLGIMLYQLLNGGRLPLLGKDARFTEIETAVARRLDGERLPMPEDADNRLGQLVCDMCAFERKQRPDASKCIRELEKLSAIAEAGGKIPPPAFRLKSSIVIPAAAAAAAIILLLLILPKLTGGEEITYPAASAPAVNAYTSGGAAGDSEWLYFGSDANGQKSYRINRQTGAREDIYDGSITHINLCGDQLYFSANHTLESVERLEDGGLLVSMRSGVRGMNSDGTGERILCRCDTLTAVEYDGWVYHYVANLNLNFLSSVSDSDTQPTFSRIMRVKTDGSTEEELCLLENVHVSGMYVYRDRIYLVCRDYSAENEPQAYVLSVSLDGTESFRVLDHDVSSIDFHEDCILYTTERLGASDLMKVPLDGSGTALKVGSVQARRFCVWGDSLIYSTGKQSYGGSGENYGLFVCGIDGSAPRRLLDGEESVDRMQLAGDTLVASTDTGDILLIDIAGGEVTQLTDFRFELY